MARRFILSDDMSGNEGDDVKTLVYMVQGQHYEIDLSDANRKSFDKALRRFNDKARKITRLRAASLVNETTSDAEDVSAIREWAKAQDENETWQVGDKGRISAEVREAYVKAHAENDDNDDNDDNENDDNNENGEDNETAP